MTEVPGPDGRAEMMAFTALVLERAQADPDRAPGNHLIEWHRSLARRLEILPRHPQSHRELLDCALRLHRIYRGFPDPLRNGPPTPHHAATKTRVLAQAVREAS